MVSQWVKQGREHRSASVDSGEFDAGYIRLALELDTLQQPAQFESWPLVIPGSRSDGICRASGGGSG